jgi:predicted amidohydrolase YtcJ
MRSHSEDTVRPEKGCRAARAIALALVTLVGFAGVQFAGQVAAPDLILFNGKIFTSDAAHSYVQAVAIRGERIVATGDSPKIKALAQAQTRQLDLGGRTVIPGINDAHEHIYVGPPELLRLSLKTQDPTWPELKDAIVAANASAPQGAFILGIIGPTVFHDPSVTRDTLDQAAPDHAVGLWTLTGHAAILNSAALKKLGIRENEQDPVGGRYERSADGRLTGVLREYAVERAYRTVGSMPSDVEALKELRGFFSEAAKFGITSMQDMSNGIEPGRAVKLFEEAPTPIRIRIMRMPLTTPAGRDTQEGLSVPRHPSPMITVSGTKWMVDGVAVENTFTPRDVPFPPPGQPPDYVVQHLPLTFSEKELEAMLRESLASNDQPLFHVSGYLGAAAMLHAMQTTGGSQVWAGRRVRFEHGDGLFPDLIPLAKEMGILVIQNPTHFGVPPGSPTFKAADQLRSLLAAGIPVALGSDGPMNPYLNIMLACIHPANPPEAISREQAVIAYTLTAAYAEFQEKEKGSLEPGKLADLAVLSQDIFSVPLFDLPKTESVLTLVGGKVVYDANVMNGN